MNYSTYSDVNYVTDLVSQKKVEPSLPVFIIYMYISSISSCSFRDTL